MIVEADNNIVAIERKQPSDRVSRSFKRIYYLPRLWISHDRGLVERSTSEVPASKLDNPNNGVGVAVKRHHSSSRVNVA